MTVGAWRVSCAGHHEDHVGTLQGAIAIADLAAWTFGHVATVAEPDWTLRGWRLVYTARPPADRARVPLPEGVRA
jgi:hypothetical protein